MHSYVKSIDTAKLLNAPERWISTPAGLRGHLRRWIFADGRCFEWGGGGIWGWKVKPFCRINWSGLYCRVVVRCIFPGPNCNTRIQQQQVFLDRLSCHWIAPLALIQGTLYGQAFSKPPKEVLQQTEMFCLSRTDYVPGGSSQSFVTFWMPSPPTQRASELCSACQSLATARASSDLEQATFRWYFWA